MTDALPQPVRLEIKPTPMKLHWFMDPNWTQDIEIIQKQGIAVAVVAYTETALRRLHDHFELELGGEDRG